MSARSAILRSMSKRDSSECSRLCNVCRRSCAHVCVHACVLWYRVPLSVAFTLHFG
jgi:hypothetical protein